MERDMNTKEDLKSVALGMSKINYLNPRITVAWCKRHDVPIEKVNYFDNFEGIEGVLRNSAGSSECQFSISVGIQRPIAVELLTILKACELCSSNISLIGINIQVVSDSLDDVSLVNNEEDFGNLSYFQVISDIRGFLRSFNGLSIRYNSRSLNVDADCLAKRSSAGGKDSIEWFRS
ncbi:hypothetical protein QYF36_015178 [Acer negundo]|nr:hypothetical protein QYF36_015178 [Acer negundo]